MKHRLNLLLIVSGLALLPISVTAEETNALESLQQSFQKQEQALLDGYGAALGTLMAEFKKKGDLDLYLVVETENERFQTEKYVPSLSDANVAFKSAAGNYNKARAAVLKRYISALEDLVKTEVQADRVESAKAVKAEKEKIAFELADFESKLPQPTAKKKTEPKTDSAALPSSGSREVVIKSATYGAGKIRVDVKSILLNMIKDDMLELRVDNRLFGDPAYGQEKTLRVEYTLGNVTKVIEMREGAMLTLQIKPKVVVPQLRGGRALSDGEVKQLSGEK